MAWQNTVVGYKIVELTSNDVIPVGATFLTTTQRYAGHFGWASNMRAHYETIYHYQVPVYKKKNIKRIEVLNQY
jgi:hypothetical protein